MMVRSIPGFFSGVLFLHGLAWGQAGQGDDLARRLANRGERRSAVAEIVANATAASPKVFLALAETPLRRSAGRTYLWG